MYHFAWLRVDYYSPGSVCEWVYVETAEQLPSAPFIVIISLILVVVVFAELVLK